MAQAVCLEKMFNVKVEKGYIYYDKSKQRREVHLHKGLRKKLKETVQSSRKLLINKEVPDPANDNRCINCSLNQVCLPKLQEKADRFCKELLK